MISYKAQRLIKECLKSRSEFGKNPTPLRKKTNRIQLSHVLVTSFWVKISRLFNCWQEVDELWIWRCRPFGRRRLGWSRFSTGFIFRWQKLRGPTCFFYLKKKNWIPLINWQALQLLNDLYRGVFINSYLSAFFLAQIIWNLCMSVYAWKKNTHQLIIKKLENKPKRFDKWLNFSRAEMVCRRNK